MEYSRSGMMRLLINLHVVCICTSTCTEAMCSDKQRLENQCCTVLAHCVINVLSGCILSVLCCLSFIVLLFIYYRHCGLYFSFIPGEPSACKDAQNTRRLLQRRTPSLLVRNSLGTGSPLRNRLSKTYSFRPNSSTYPDTST